MTLSDVKMCQNEQFAYHFFYSLDSIQLLPFLV